MEPETRNFYKKEQTGTQRIEKEGWVSLISGLVIASLVLYIPFLSFIFRYLITLVHEIGHAVFGWLFGYPSIPAFDFTYGGGVTIHQDRKILIVVVVYLLAAGLLYLYRRNGLTFLILLGVVALYSITAFTHLHYIVFLFMGHGTELIFCGIFFYRAMSGSSIVVAAERPLYAFLGFFIFFLDLQFAHRLMTSPMHRADYAEAKGGGHWMDFSRLAEEYLDIELSSMASIFLVFCLLTPILTYLFFRYKEHLFSFFRRVLTPES